MDRTLALVAVLAGCGSSAEPDHKTPPSVKTVGAELRLPEGFDGSALSLDATLVLPRNLERFKTTIESNFLLLRLITVAPRTVAFPTDATLVTTIRGCPSGNAIAVALDKNQLPEVLSSHVAGQDLEIPIKETARAIAVLCPNPNLIGTPAQLIRGVPELLMEPDCSGYVTPDTAMVKAIAADPKRFSIDPDGAIHLDAKLERRPVDEATELVKADQVLARGGGDPVSLGVVYASLLAARGYPVMLVGGEVKSAAGKGITLWVEVVVDGKPAYVDLADAAHPKLVPLADAMTANGLAVHRGCAWYPAGTTNDATIFSSAPKPAEPDPTGLVAQHAQLDKQCNHGANKPACMERGKVDDQLRKQLADMLGRHKDLETRCKLGKDPAACTERERLADQGKAIKALLDAKP